MSDSPTNRQPASPASGDALPRVPRGVPTGGQFAPSAHAEAQVSLDRPDDTCPECGWGTRDGRLACGPDCGRGAGMTQQPPATNPDGLKETRCNEWRDHSPHEWPAQWGPGPEDYNRLWCLGDRWPDDGPSEHDLNEAWGV